MTITGAITALAGGVGAAKFLRGLVRAVDPREVTVIGNTGDDAVFHGLHVSPDLDIVTYTLAGIVDEQTGWGVTADTTRSLDQMRSLGIDPWFRLGDRDLGTHLARTQWLGEGVSLSEVTDRVRRALGVETRLVPMSDDPVRTKIETADGEVLEFQEYFVRRRHEDEVARVWFEGAESARPAPGVLDAISSAETVIVCPSNPAVSIGPILAVPGIRESLAARRDRVVAVSPIVRGAALKGPADRMLPAIGAKASASGVAALYADFAGMFVIDHRDAAEAQAVEGMDLEVLIAETIMDSPATAERLAKEILAR
jgi:LPPG:FO 2-phospho-L-lactate transferase